MNEKKIKVATGVVLYNSEGKVFLARGKKWNDKWAVPGGGVDHGESIDACIRREVKEETGLDICEVQYVGAVESIFPEGFHTPMHFIFFDYLARVCDDHQEVILNEEFDEYGWFAPEEAKDIVWNKVTADFIQVYIDHRDTDTLGAVAFGS